ncbi:MAG: hypothetical protein ACP5I8_07780 [Phycisphaerae bacterium]
MIPPEPSEQNELDRITSYPFFRGGLKSGMGEEQDEISVQIPLQFTVDFWENCALVDGAAKQWDITQYDCMFRLLRLRPASDQNKSLEDTPTLLDQVETLSVIVADNAFARSKL